MYQAEAVRRAILDAVAVLAPVECSGCGAPDRSVCDACVLALAPVVTSSTRESPLGSITIWSALEYSGVPRRVIGAYKDGGRTDAATALSVPLSSAVAAALEAYPPGEEGVRPVRLVAIPSSRRAWRLRGFSPVDLLLRRAGLAGSPLLRHTRQADDQVGLGREAREHNKRGSLAAVGSLDGIRCLLVDDVVTTGATLLEARRAITSNGGDVVGFATLAHTPKRSAGVLEVPQEP